MTAHRRVVALGATFLLVMAVLAGGACSSDDGDASGVLDQVAPTKADVAKEAGIEFPASVAGFRLVRLGAGQIDVTFTLAPGDVDDFARGSGIELEPDRRAIVHASPLWDVAVKNPLRGGESTRRGVKRSVEVVDEGGVERVRLTLLVN